MLNQIIYINASVEGISNASFFQIYGPSVDNSGRVFFTAKFNMNYGLFMYDAGKITLLAQGGQVLPGVGQLTEMSYLDASDSGVVTFVSSLDNGALGIFKLNACFQTIFPQVADGAYEDQWSWRTTLLLSNPDSSYPASLSIDFILVAGAEILVSSTVWDNSE
jgi:hypothetical protein